ncbi:MAG: GIY-YIG nuclease family protein [Chloroflexi bacterium]|nr:GIY-YIG nuclease family protein [Chloroflexota bacterium]
MAKRYYVYMATNASRTLYVGMTNDLPRRAAEHQVKTYGGFTARYNIGQLVYFEETADVREAIAREKQIKRWSRRKKIALIESLNPTWADLASVDPEG